MSASDRSRDRPANAASSRPHRRGLGGPAPGAGRSGGLRDVLDIGGGTGGFAVRVAELGHRVTVVDPSPDALASLARRARERRASRSPASRATWAACSSSPAPPAPTWCSATASSRWSTTPPPRWPRSARCCAPAAPSACWSPSATPPSSPGRWPATSPRPWPCSTTPTTAPGRSGRRFTADEVTALLAGAGFEVASVHGVRVFADLVPGSLLDLEPGATAALRRARARRLRARRSTSRWPRSCTCSRADARPPARSTRERRAVSGRRGPTALPDPARRHGRLLRLGGDPGPARAAGRPGDRGRRVPRGGALGQLPRPARTASARRCRSTRARRLCPQAVVIAAGLRGVRARCPPR